MIATTNELNNLPDSLLRAGRFDINLIIQGLDKDDQIKLINHFLKSKSFLEEIAPEQIIDIIGGGASCAELEKIINDAAIKVAFENRDTVTRDDIIFACLNHKFGGAYSTKRPSEQSRRKTAYHEAGHIVVGEIIAPNSVSLASIKPYRSSSSGVTCLFDMGDFKKTYSFKIGQITLLLGGKAATEIVFDEPDIGTKSDLKNARDILEDLRDDNAAFGFERIVHWSTSEATRREGELTVAAELKKYYEKAREIIIANQPFLDAVAAALLEKETIFATDIQQIKNDLGLAKTGVERMH